MKNSVLKKKVIEGNKLALQKLLEQKKTAGLPLIVSQNGKVTKLPAAETDLKS